MKKSRLFVLILFLLCTLTLSSKTTDYFRAFASTTLSPLWIFFFSCKQSYSTNENHSLNKENLSEKIKTLQLDNYNLCQSVELLKSQIDLQNHLIEKYVLLNKSKKDQPNLEKKQREILHLIDQYTKATNARIIFRDISSWSSSFWIDVGEKKNQILGRVVISKNSPVIAGNSIVGIVEYVDQYRSRVRLITDPRLTPSIRVARGDESKIVLFSQIQKLLQLIEFLEKDEEVSFIQKNLLNLRHKIELKNENLYLAKGELKGSKKLLWETKQPIFQGIGFNYDFEDPEGGPRDLRSGNLEQEQSLDKNFPLIRKNDILITTGMDGIFPAGLYAGRVKYVYPLKEGSSSYDIDVDSFIEDFNDLSWVTVLPPTETIY